MNEKRAWSAALVAVLSIGCSATVYAWGQEGHRITAEIAQRNLSNEVKNITLAILGGESLAQVSTWPDEIRSYPSWNCAKPYHFVTKEPGARYPARDVAEGDSVEALFYFTDVLRSDDADAESRRIALSFLVHLVGDMHQPLHNGRGCDAGGNFLKVKWFGENVNFHSVWDSLMIESEKLSFGEWADFLNHATGEKVAGLQASTPVDWVDESQALLDGAYSCFTSKPDSCPCFCGDCPDGKSSFGGCRSPEKCSLMVTGPVAMSYTYKAVNLNVVRKQLLKGGLRLAGLLTWILDDNVAPPKDFTKMAERVRNLRPDKDPKMAGQNSISNMMSCRGVSSVQ